MSKRVRKLESWKENKWGNVSEREWSNIRQLRYLCEANDFGDKRDETRRLKATGVEIDKFCYQNWNYSAKKVSFKSAEYCLGV